MDNTTLSNGKSKPIGDPKPAWHTVDEEENGKEERVVELRSLENYLHRVEMLLALFGIHYKRRDPVTAKKEGCVVKYFNSTIVYNIFVLLSFWSGFIRSCLSFLIGNIDDRFNTLKVIPVLWSFQIAATATIVFKASHPKLGSRHKACQFWKDNIMKRYNDINIQTNVAPLRRRLFASFVVCLAVIVSNICGATLLLFLPYSELIEIFAVMIMSPLPISTYSKLLMVGYQLFASVAWLTPMLHLGILGTILNTMFALTSSSLQQRIGEQSSQPPRNLKDFRILHLNMCRLVEILDTDVKFLFANWYCTYIPLACFILYAMVKNQMDTLSLSLAVFWFVSSVGSVAFVSVFAAKLHEMAHAQLDSMYDLAMHDATVQQIGEVHLFLSKLTSKSTGFTVMNLVTITKELLLTIGGLFLTYFFLILQF